PVAVTILAAMLALHRAVARPSAARFALAGLALGLALLTKVTTLLVVPVAAVLVALADAPPGRRVRAWLSRTALGFAVALRAVNAGYLFRGSLSRLDALPLTSAAGSAVLRTVPGWVPVPLPRDLVLGLDAQKKIAERGEFGSYLAGRWWTAGAPRQYE